MKQWIYYHKKESIIIGISLMMLLFILIFTKIFFFSSGSNVYGDRLDGIDKVKINNDKFDKINSELKTNNEITKVDAFITGKVINFLVTVKSGASLDNTKENSTKILNELSKKEKDFYDVQVYIVNDTFSAIGYKGKESTEFVWINS